MTRMKLLWIEDDMLPIAGLRLQLVNAGHEVDVVRQGVTTAYEKLVASFARPEGGYDCVIIDLSLPDEPVPASLMGPYQPLAPIGSFSMNQGQAIGQWMWESEGRFARSGRPWHFYLTHVGDQYYRHPDGSRQEFKSSDGTFQSRFVVSKWDVTNLAIRLSELEEAWRQHFSSSIATSGVAP